MTGPAVELVMIWIKRPAGRVMRKTGALFCIMTFGAGIIDVTVVADCMDLFLSPARPSRFLKVMAIAAVLFPVTVNAAKTEQVDMLLALFTKTHYGKANVIICSQDL